MIKDVEPHSLRSGENGAGVAIARAAELMPSGWGRLLPAATAGACLAVAAASCSHESPVAPAAAGACAYVVSPKATSISTAAGTFQISVTTNAAARGCVWTVSTSNAWLHPTGATGGLGTGVVEIAADGTATARQGTVTVSWAGGSQSVAVTQSCDLTQTLNLSPEGQEFVVFAPLLACRFSVSSVSTDVPWISVKPTQFFDAHPPPPRPDSFTGVVGVNTGPERIGHLTTPFGQVTVIQREGNCVTALAPTSQAFDESGGAGSISVTAVPGCAWDATTHFTSGAEGQIWITPLTAHGIGSGVLQFTVAANKNTLARALFYLIGGSLQSQVTQSGCPLTVSPLSFHVPAAAADYVVSVRVTGAVSCDWTYYSNDRDLFSNSVFAQSRSGSADVTLSVTQNQTGKTRSGTATVANQTVVVTQDP